MSHAGQQAQHTHTVNTTGSTVIPEETSISNALNITSVFLTKTASIAYLDIQGPSALRFNMNDSVTRQIFLPEHFSKNTGSVNLSNNILRRIHINKIFVAPGTSNSFPFPLGLKIGGIPNTEFTSEGDAFAYIIPQKFTLGTDICIFESIGDESLMKTWEEDFAKWNSDNLETLCAMRIPESESVLVHVEHPVAQLLEKKYADFNTTPPSQQMSTTPNWRQIDSHTFDRACAWLRDNILSKSSKTFDMSQLTVSIARPNNSKFTDLPPSFFVDMPIQGTESISELTDIQNKFANITIQRPFNIDIKLKFQFRLPTMDSISR